MSYGNGNKLPIKEGKILKNCLPINQNTCSVAIEFKIAPFPSITVFINHSVQLMNNTLQIFFRCCHNMDKQRILLFCTFFCNWTYMKVMISLVFSPCHCMYCILLCVILVVFIKHDKSVEFIIWIFLVSIYKSSIIICHLQY